MTRSELEERLRQKMTDIVFDAGGIVDKVSMTALTRAIAPLVEAVMHGTPGCYTCEDWIHEHSPECPLNPDGEFIRGLVGETDEEK